MTYVAFLAYPIVGWIFFSTMRLIYAIPATLFFGFLMLPSGFDINAPVLPALNKYSMPAFVTIAMILVFYRRANPHDRLAQHREATANLPSDVLDSWLPKQPWVLAFLFMIVVGPFFTFLFNREPVVWPTITMQGIRLYDSLNAMQTGLVVMLAFFVGRRFLPSDDGHRAILLVMAVGGLLYSLPTLAEVRLSPQLHNIVYGYFQSSWIQHLRTDGFRPIVFMDHGLVLSLVLCLCALSIMAYVRAIDGDKRILYVLASLYMLVVVILSKSLGMALVAGSLIPILMFASVRVQMLCAALIACIVLTYPVSRAVGISPLQPIVMLVEPVAPNRASSLNYRLDAETVAVDRAAEKPIFGWGGFGRSEARSELGWLLFARDGHWMIVLGQSGIAGFLGVYGLLCIPIALLALRQRRYGLTFATSGLCIVMAANLVDLIPNAGLTPMTWLIAGALLGRVELGAQRERAGAVAEPAAAPVPAHGRPAPERPARKPSGAPPEAPLAARLRRRPADASEQDGGAAANTADEARPEDVEAGGGHVYSRFANTHVRKTRTS